MSVVSCAHLNLNPWVEAWEEWRFFHKDNHNNSCLITSRLTHLFCTCLCGFCVKWILFQMVSNKVDFYLRKLKVKLVWNHFKVWYKFPDGLQGISYLRLQTHCQIVQNVPFFFISVHNWLRQDWLSPSNWLCPWWKEIHTDWKRLCSQGMHWVHFYWTVKLGAQDSIMNRNQKWII